MIFIATDLQKKRKTIKTYIDEILSQIDDVEDHEVLDRAHTLLMQTSTAIKVTGNLEKTDLMNFTRQDKFPPAQKNEKQLQLKKTVGNPGRRKKPVIRYVVSRRKT